MDLKISPRNKNDRGGVACMPLRRNVPEGREGWKLTTCPNCGRECWEMPLLDVVKAQGASALCTECALRQGAENVIKENTDAIAVYLTKDADIDAWKKNSDNALKNLNSDLQQFFMRFGVSENDFAVIEKAGKKNIVIRESIGRKMMEAIATALIADGHMTLEEAAEYMKNGSDPVDSEGGGK